jgi:hypothetical protein
MTQLKGLRACGWLCSVTLGAVAGGMAHAGDLAPRPGPDLVPAVEIAGPPMAILTPSSIQDAGSFQCRKQTFMAIPRVFAPQRFVSRVACMRIPSCFRNAVTIGSLPCQLALNATSGSPKIRQAFAKLVDHSGQAIRRDIGYHQAAGFDASATNRWSRARLALSSQRGPIYRTGCSPPSGRFFPVGFPAGLQQARPCPEKRAGFLR